MDKNKEFPVSVTFTPPPLVEDRYGLPPVTIKLKKNADLPYYGLEFCVRESDGKMSSLLVADDGKTWENSLAQRIFEDPDIHKAADARCRINTQTNQARDVCVYAIMYENKDSSVFKPGVRQPISNATNVDTEFTLEFLFCFDDGFLFPLLKTVKTGGTFSMGYLDAVQEMLSDFDGPELYKLLKSSENVTKTKDGISILCSSSRSGIIRTLEFSNDGTDRFDVRRALCSVRLVDVKETIHSSKDKKEGVI